jgi:glycosyltransferase involved in cell wall biosynthesis
MKRLPLVSVIITCFNQGRFLGDAIASALGQRYPLVEVLVVDDGSTDDSPQVASSYSGIKLVRQKNRGLSAARNAGIDASGGDYLIFLDADDRLLPGAAQSGVNWLNADPDCAIVYGRYGLISAEGLAMESVIEPGPPKDAYLNMLRRNYIGMHATVMYRREVFAAVGRFETSLAACEDYHLYLRITRDFPTHGHDEVVAEYRQHAGNMSSNAGLMLKASLSALRSQRKFARENRDAWQAFRNGERHWKRFYGRRLIKDVRSRIAGREWIQVVIGIATLLRYYPRGVAEKATQKITQIAASWPQLFSIRIWRRSERREKLVR